MLVGVKIPRGGSATPMRGKSLTYRDVLFQDVAVLDRRMNKMESGRQVKDLPRISVAKPLSPGGTKSGSGRSGLTAG